MNDVKALGLSRQLVRAIYNKVDWNEYDREVVAESLPDYEAAVDALERLTNDTEDFYRDVDPESDPLAVSWGEARAALARLREPVAP